MNEGDTRREPRGRRSKTDRNLRKGVRVLGMRLQIRTLGTRDKRHVKRLIILLLCYFLAIDHHTFFFHYLCSDIMSLSTSLYHPLLFVLHLSLVGLTPLQLSSLLEALKHFPLFSLSLSPSNSLPSFVFFHHYLCPSVSLPPFPSFAVPFLSFSIYLSPSIPPPSIHRMPVV